MYGDYPCRCVCDIVVPVDGSRILRPLLKACLPPLSVDCNTPACASGGCRKLGVPVAGSSEGRPRQPNVDFQGKKELRRDGCGCPFPALDTDRENLFYVVAAWCA